MKNKKLNLSFLQKILCLFILFGNQAVAQVPTVQDCLGAIPICTEIYSEANSPSGSGNYPNEINSFQIGGHCCMATEASSIWYTFTVNQTGDFGFSLTPNNINDDYDWALFDITGKSCEDIFTDPSTQVSCNAAGNPECHGPTGADGMSIYNIQGFGCETEPPDVTTGFSAHNAFVPVVQGNTYVLCVSNWTQSTFGYTIDFGVSSDIGIFDNIVPEVTDIETPEGCDTDEIVITFSENIQCNTIDGANFDIEGPGGPYSATVSSDICNQGGTYSNIFTVSVSPPILEAGNFTVTLVSDGQTEVLDLCENPSTPFSASFEIINFPLSNLDLGEDVLLCDGDVLTLDATLPNADTYLWQDGSTDPTFLITEAGTYAVTVTNECNSIVDNITATYTSPQTISIDLGNDTILCPGEIYTLDATWNGGLNYTWQDGFEGSIYSVSESGFYEVEVEGVCGEIGNANVTIEYDDAPLDLDLGVDSLLCEEDGLYFLSATNPRALTYLWDDGSTSPILEATDSRIYSVTITDNCKSVTDEISLEYTNCTICEVYVPNAFSPDFNGYNDIFRPYSNCVLENYSMKIFNRWGAMVFESNNVDTGWDGRFNNKDVDEGVYVYLFEFEVNQMGENIIKKLSGDITVLK